MAVYVVPENVWFIMPEAVLHGRRSVGLRPGLEKSKYAGYRENWELLK